VLLVTFDTTRADRVGAYGATAGVTPHLDALAARGLRFERAYATAPITLPSHASMLTGTYPCAHGVRDNTVFTLASDSVLVSEVLAERGFRTAACVGGFVLDARFGLDQGFEHYGGPGAAGFGASPEVVERSAQSVTDEALGWLAGVARDEPFFLWVHYYDPHMPHVPPEPWASRYADRYDGEIAFADAQLGRLLDALTAAGRDKQALVIATADHGECLGEHGEGTHGVFVYEPAVRVPLIVAAPGVPLGDVASPVSVADVAPTILDWLDVSQNALPEVRLPSLLATADAELHGEPPDRAVYVESLLPYFARRWHPLRAVVWQGAKFIDGGRPELYDLGTDPAEAHDLLADTGGDSGSVPGSASVPASVSAPGSASAPAPAPAPASDSGRRGAAHRARLAQLLAEHPPLGWGARGALDEEERARLAALGYVAGTAGADPDGAFPDEGSLPDARDRIGDLAVFDAAITALREGRGLLGLDAPLPAPPDEAQRTRGEARLLEARVLLNRLRAANPADPTLTGALGLVEQSRGDHAAAVALFEEAAAHDPQPAVTHFNLGLSYAALGHGDQALAEMHKVLSIEPRMAPAYDWLARAHEQAGRFGRAAWWRRRQDDTWDGPEDPRLDVQREARRLQARAAAAGQPVAGPDGFPTDDLVPAGLRARDEPR
jgi:arylsulfatase A-like enzyme